MKKLNLFAACALFISGVFYLNGSIAQTKDSPGIKIDFNQFAGTIKKLHGVNGGPFCYSDLQQPIEKFHAEAGFPYTRLHDVNWPHADAVDIHTIFPDFDADPNDAKNYHFQTTDDYLIPILKNHSEIIFRLGVNIEHKTTYFLAPPKDYEKWAKICIQIIKHYNEGWANGHHYNIKYWEIYNEPDNKRCWRGTRDEFFKFFATASKILKAHDGNLKIGGPGFTNINTSWTKPFLQYCKDNKVPIDFFSWHAYYPRPDMVYQDALLARKLLDQYGYTRTESHLNEWNYLKNGWEELFPGKKEVAPEVYENVHRVLDRIKGPEGAVFAANVLILLQDTKVDVANFFNADYNPLSMFDYFGIPTKVYYAFKQFNQICQTGNRVAVEYAKKEPTLQLLAGCNSERTESMLLLSNDARQNSAQKIGLLNLPAGREYTAEYYVTDALHNMTLIKTEQGIKAGAVLSVNLNAESVTLVKLKAK